MMIFYKSQQVSTKSKWVMYTDPTFQTCGETACGFHSKSTCNWPSSLSCRLCIHTITCQQESVLQMAIGAGMKVPEVKQRQDFRGNNSRLEQTPTRACSSNYADDKDAQENQRGRRTWTYAVSQMQCFCLAKFCCFHSSLVSIQAQTTTLFNAFLCLCVSNTLHVQRFFHLRKRVALAKLRAEGSAFEMQASQAAPKAAAARTPAATEVQAALFSLPSLVTTTAKEPAQSSCHQSAAAAAKRLLQQPEARLYLAIFPGTTLLFWLCQCCRNIRNR